MSKKKTIFILIFILLLCIGVFFSYKFIKAKNTYSNIIQANWEIELPLEYKEIYSIDSRHSFLGDGERYHIFEYANKDKVEEVLSWQSGKNIIMESSIISILKALKVPDEYIPKLESDYKYYFKTKSDSSMLYMVFSEEANRVYIVEDIR
ncbi:MAG TPA: hypothetical protein DCM59_07720 [Clostridium sp.]|nr:hypothetical protein [Clostridium sp.]